MGDLIMGRSVMMKILMIGMDAPLHVLLNPIQVDRISQTVQRARIGQGIQILKKVDHLKSTKFHQVAHRKWREVNAGMES